MEQPDVRGLTSKQYQHFRSALWWIALARTRQESSYRKRLQEQLEQWLEQEDYVKAYEAVKLIEDEVNQDIIHKGWV